MRALERVLEDIERQHNITNSSLHRQRLADDIERGLRDELLRDPSGLRDLGLEPATLQDEDGDYIECWVFIL